MILIPEPVWHHSSMAHHKVHLPLSSWDMVHIDSTFLDVVLVWPDGQRRPHGPLLVQTAVFGFAFRPLESGRTKSGKELAGQSRNRAARNTQ